MLLTMHDRVDIQQYESHNQRTDDLKELGNNLVSSQYEQQALLTQTFLRPVLHAMRPQVHARQQRADLCWASQFFRRQVAQNLLQRDARAEAG